MQPLGRKRNIFYSHFNSNTYIIDPYKARIISWTDKAIIISWPNRASKRTLAGPNGPARYLLLAQQGQQKIENLDKKEAILAENAAEIATCVLCLKPNNDCWASLQTSK